MKQKHFFNCNTQKHEDVESINSRQRAIGFLFKGANKTLLFLSEC